MQQESVPEPKSLAEVEKLIQALYEPSNSQLVPTIQSNLQVLQKSSDGWQLADALLNSHDDKVKFFGALTFTVKLNSDWSSLDSESTSLLLSRLLNWLARLAKGTENAVVTQKLCSTLATYFLRPKAPWVRCVRTVICMLGEGSAVEEQLLDQYPPSPQILLHLDANNILAALWFASAVADDGGKMESSNQEHALVQERLNWNIEEAAGLIFHAFQYNGLNDMKVRDTGISCFANWVFYTLRSKSTDVGKLRPLRALIQPALEHCLPRSDEAIDVFVDLLSSYQSFFQYEHLQAISLLIGSQWGQLQLDELVAGKSQSIQFGRLVLAFAELNMEDMFSAPTNPKSVQIMYNVHQLLKSPGHPGDEDDLSIYTVDFWINFVTYVADNLGQMSSERMKFAKDHLVTAVINLWKKCQIPPADVLMQWDSDTRKAFGEFRADVRDLFDASYSALYLDFLNLCADYIMEALKEQNWSKVEVGLFTVGTIADSLNGISEEDQILARIFCTPLFRELSQKNDHMPTRLHRTAVDAVGSLSSFVERNTQYLADALNFLFTSLTSRSLVHISSKSIFALCSSSRKQLSHEVDTLLYHYLQFRSSPDADNLTKEKVLSAIAAVVQGLSPEEAKIGPLDRMLNIVESDIEVALLMNQEAQSEPAELAFQCLAGISRALQDPDDGPLNLDSDQEVTESNIWADGIGTQIQRRIKHCLEVGINSFGTIGDIIESIFATLRSGFTEVTPGPFVLDPQFTVDLLERTTLNTPRLEYALATASMLLNTHSGASSRDVGQEVRRILQYVCSLIQLLLQRTDDPEVAQSCIDVLASMLSRYAHILIAFQPFYNLERVLSFTIQCLHGSDILPKRSAASFWKAFITLNFNDTVLQTQYENLVEIIGQPVADALIHNVGGNASRSELDLIAEPLKKLVTKHPMVRSWFENALFNSNFPSEKVGPAEKRKFLSQIVSARGSKTTNNVIKNFWIACRGTLVYSS